MGLADGFDSPVSLAPLSARDDGSMLCLTTKGEFAVKCTVASDPPRHDAKSREAVAARQAHLLRKREDQISLQLVQTVSSARDLGDKLEPLLLRPHPAVPAGAVYECALRLRDACVRMAAVASSLGVGDDTLGRGDDTLEEVEHPPAPGAGEGGPSGEPLGLWLGRTRAQALAMLQRLDTGCDCLEGIVTAAAAR
eukprot:CAMPEP_0174924470 /NCGR_PEP_ID=MMETSP1355-20121228/7271_1 /TAXON_ID=464990 /ORGANISM="Hemiselmis tepida, Strain CCMP443" /LENGTH=194 /DNA_ID=CAMNT_0016170279 /DNA_START=245 /DNA_END=825 /DNA_ORIENTATION=-